MNARESRVCTAHNYLCRSVLALTLSVRGRVLSKKMPLNASVFGRRVAVNSRLGRTLPDSRSNVIHARHDGHSAGIPSSAAISHTTAMHSVPVGVCVCVCGVCVCVCVCVCTIMRVGALDVSARVCVEHTRVGITHSTVWLSRLCGSTACVPAASSASS
jgi:hypothetical protein